MKLPEHITDMPTAKYAQVKLEYQNNIPDLPVRPELLFQQACSSDKITVDSWRPTWIKNITDNKKLFGNFKDHSISKIYKAHEFKPAIVAGSGSSLAENVHQLKDRGDIPLISCLHNFHLMEDNGAHPDYYVSLDAGPVVLEELAEGGKKTPEEYWELTKDRTLLAYVGSPPELFKKWKGKIYLYNCLIPDPSFLEEINKIEAFKTWVSNGGNVLGACLYIARAFLGCGTVAFVGADFCFSYDNKFHAWDSKYDKNLGNVIRMVDVFGNRRLTWQSYANFKCWFEHLAYTSPQIFINCSEGGCFGAFPEGNLAQIRQMKLSRFLLMHRMHELIEDQCLTPETAESMVLF